MIDKADNLATIILAAMVSAPEGETESTVARIIRHHRRQWLEAGFEIAREHVQLTADGAEWDLAQAALDTERRR